MTPDAVAQPADLETVRKSYDRVADTYANLFATSGMGDVRTQPWLRAALDVFAESVRDLGPVLDVGCGPGQVTAYLAKRGLDVSGIDLSPRMIEHARRLHPHCSYEIGSATGKLRPTSLAGVLGWWSLFHLPRRVVPQVLASFAQALVPGGSLIVATHAGDGEETRTEAYGGVPVSWTTHRWQPEAFADMVTAVGLRLVAEVRLPGDEHSGPAFVLVAQRPPSG